MWYAGVDLGWKSLVIALVSNESSSVPPHRFSNQKGMVGPRTSLINRGIGSIVLLIGRPSHRNVYGVWDMFPRREEVNEFVIAQER